MTQSIPRCMTLFQFPISGVRYYLKPSPILIDKLAQQFQTQTTRNFSSLGRVPSLGCPDDCLFGCQVKPGDFLYVFPDTNSQVCNRKIKPMPSGKILPTAKNPQLCSGMNHRIAKNLKNALQKLFRYPWRHAWHLRSVNQSGFDVSSKIAIILDVKPLIGNRGSPRIGYSHSPIVAQETVL